MVESQVDRITELEKEVKGYQVALSMPNNNEAHNLEQQAKGIEDAVTKLERPDAPCAPCEILNDDLLDFASALRNQSLKAMMEQVK